eukprot:g1423.t1
MGRRQRQKAIENSRKGKKTKQKQKQGKEGKQKVNSHSTRGPALEDELYKKGLRVKYMLADGNCFFRSIGDQLYGNDQEHVSIRLEVISFMESNRELFQPFVDPCLDDNEDFDSYIIQMKQEGSWAGDFEVHAASLYFNVDICIYQVDNGALQCLCNRSPMSSKIIHISYHGGEHYNSVRQWGDYDNDPPLPIEMTTTMQNKGHHHQQSWTWKDEKRIMEETGCYNDGLIHTYLQQCNGNVNVVVKKVYEWMTENEITHEKVESDENNPIGIECSSEEAEDPPSTSEPSTTSGVEETQETYPSSNKVLYEDSVVVHTKRPANNKPCPCGSKQKYKHCCKITDRKKERENSKIQEAASSEVMDANNEMSLLARTEHSSEEVSLEIFQEQMKWNDYKEAVETMTQALEKFGPTPKLLASLGQVLAKIGDVEGASRTLEDALRLDPTNEATVLRLGCIKQMNGSCNDAAKDYRCLLASVDSSKAWNNLAMCLFSQKNYSEAIGCLKESLHLDPFDWKPHFNMGCCFLHLGHYSNAVFHLKAAINLNKKHPASWSWLGVALTRLGDHSNAEQAYRNSLKLKEDPLTHLKLATMYWNSGNIQNAKTHFALHNKGTDQGHSQPKEAIQLQKLL